MEERAEELALESAREAGKPLMDSKVEAVRTRRGRHSTDHARYAD